MQQTLGDILRAQAQINSSNAAARAQEQVQAQATQESINRRTVEKYFEGLKAHITKSITENKAIADIFAGPGHERTIDDLLGFDDLLQGPGVTNKENAYHDVWVEFVAWATSQGLVVKWRRDESRFKDDAGFPEEFWYYLTVTFS
jgi:hypothetical protein